MCCESYSHANAMTECTASRFHCEGRIISTLFGLILWDIIFADIAGAFETPYQSAPLDIAEDTFYFSRKELIDRRLEELREGHAQKLIEQVYDEHADKGTWCVGVRWDIFQKADLMEIAHVRIRSHLHCVGY